MGGVLFSLCEKIGEREAPYLPSSRFNALDILAVKGSAELDFRGGGGFKGFDGICTFSGVFGELCSGKEDGDEGKNLRST